MVAGNQQTKSMKKITFRAQELIPVLKKAKEVIAKNNSLTVLDNIHVKVEGSNAQLYVSDLIVTLLATVPIVNVDETGYSFLLPFEFLNNICGLINGLDLTIEFMESGSGKSAKRTARLSTLTDEYDLDSLDNPADMPPLPQFSIDNSVGTSSEFIDWMNKSTSTVGKGNAKPAVEKIYLGIKRAGITMASTDTKVVVEKRFEATSANEAELLVNIKIAKALKGMEETSISWSKSHVAFISKGITLIGTLQEEKYVNYEPYFPQEAVTSFTVTLEELKSVMMKAALANTSATLYFKRESGVIVIESIDSKYGRKITSKIGVEFNGDCEKITISPEKVLLLLSQIHYLTVNICITAVNRPIIITTESDATYRALTMPIA